MFPFDISVNHINGVISPIPYLQMLFELLALVSALSLINAQLNTVPAGPLQTGFFPQGQQGVGTISGPFNQQGGAATPQPQPTFQTQPTGQALPTFPDVNGLLGNAQGGNQNQVAQQPQFPQFPQTPVSDQIQNPTPTRSAPPANTQFQPPTANSSPTGSSNSGNSSSMIKPLSGLSLFVVIVLSLF